MNWKNRAEGKNKLESNLGLERDRFGCSIRSGEGRMEEAARRI